METLETLKIRRSIREFKDEPISEENRKKILMAGLSGPSCVNSKDYELIVIDDKKILEEAADGNGYAAHLLKGAQFGVLVCGNLDKAFERAKDYWIIDSSIVCQNMILAATSLGIGSCWLGTYPQSGKVAAQKKIFNLPENIIPHSIIAFGYPTEEELERKKNQPKEYSKECIHINKW